VPPNVLHCPRTQEPHAQSKDEVHNWRWQMNDASAAGWTSWNAETLTMIASMAPNSFNASFMMCSQAIRPGRNGRGASARLAPPRQASNQSDMAIFFVWLACGRNRLISSQQPA
jgi:hypothetical protein